MKHKKIRQIAAIIGIVLLLGMYLTTLILAIIHHDKATEALRLSVMGTIIVPFVLYCILMFYRLANKKEAPEDKIYADEADDPYTDEDIKEIEETLKRENQNKN